jgi:secreted trypsin-like serine protease
MVQPALLQPPLPLLMQVAISSYGYDVKCGAYVTSGVVTDVRYHAAWIQATIAKLLFK